MRASFENAVLQPMRPVLIVALIILSVLNSSGAFCQGLQGPVIDSTATYRVQTSDGNTYVGSVIYDDGQNIRMKTEVGEITILKKNIVHMETVGQTQMVNGMYWPRYPQSTRYLWMPNAYGLRQGEAYYQNVWVLFNQFSMGVTNNFSLSAGLIPLFLFNGTSTPVWGNAKFSIPLRKDRVNVGAGLLYGGVIGNNVESGHVGVTYGLLTLGGPDRNSTLGVGYAFDQSGWARYPTFNYSAMIRVGPHGYFLTENYFISSPGYNVLLLSLGGRAIAGRVSIDYGAFLPVASDQQIVFFIPWLGVTVPLSKEHSN